jgi:hypothetical protein
MRSQVIKEHLKTENTIRRNWKKRVERVNPDCLPFQAYCYDFTQVCGLGQQKKSQKNSFSYPQIAALAQ